MILASLVTYSLSCLSAPQEEEDKIEQKIMELRLLISFMPPSNRNAKCNIAAMEDNLFKVFSRLFLIQSGFISRP